MIYKTGGIMLSGKKILITGAARRIGREFALAAARQHAHIIIHHGHSPEQAIQTADEVRSLGGEADIIQADFSQPEQAKERFKHLFSRPDQVFALINSAAIFKPVKFPNTTIQDWEEHLHVNLTMPFLLSQLFAKSIKNTEGKIINILDWRALRPGIDHFPYTISKSALVGLTKSLAYSLAPTIQVNGIALGAILPPADGNESSDIIANVPAQRWSTMKELTDTFLFLLNGPGYITGEIIHLDGGRHLV
jgi:NAD(P)-dependent dehydrogenase (short-subunit alcohol dehydrogenase family)